MKATRPKFKDLPIQKQETIKARALAFYYKKKDQFREGAVLG